MILKTCKYLSAVFLKQSQAWVKISSILAITSLLSACLSSSTQAPVSSRTPPPSTKLSTHVVAPGETLYSIAWRYGLDYRRLAAANRIGEDFEIFPGQIINLREGMVPETTANNRSFAQARTGSQAASRDPYRAGKNRSRPSASNQSNTKFRPFYDTNQKIHWRWPAKGRVITEFSTKQDLKKGIDIAGEKGDAVFAAASGQVVYAGNGLRGYGKLVIIKHSKAYLSAYAHNHRLRVSEGDAVKAGQRIADIGATGTGANGKPKLHFQIRRNGKPVNPVSLLPRREA